MYKQEIEQDLKKAVKELGFETTDIVVYISENVLFGDYATNIALQLSKQKSKKSYQNSREIASDLVEAFGHPTYLERIDIAGPGFINFYLKDTALIKELSEKSTEQRELDEDELPERVLVEYASPNAFKPLHIGHLRNITTGESISRILYYSGKDIYRVTYTSDIGPAVAKAIFGIKSMSDKFTQVEEKGSLDDKARFLGDAYVAGNAAYEANPEDKAEIDQINVKIYQGDPELTKLWQKTRLWSEAYLAAVYVRLGTEFDYELWESEMGERGMEVVREHLGSVFKESDGAIIFEGEKHGLHNRVFITSKGTPTYEAKELAVTMREQELFPYDRAIHIVGAEQTEVFKVTTKAIELIDPQITGKKKHLGYGFVSLSTGKMSSRLGNVIVADDLIDQVKEKIKETYPDNTSDVAIEKIAIAAIKFAYLKYGLSSDISFDVEQSVALHGDSGPYLLYTYARINSILEKARAIKPEAKTSTDLEPEEREVLRQIDYFEAIADRAAKELSPTDLANYLLNLAKSFNQFYEKHPVLGSKKQDLRLKITTTAGEKLKLGCYLLGFDVLDKM